MSGDHRSNHALAGRGVTLNSLKDELYSLNMRMLLAMQNHDPEEQENVRQQMAVIQAAIDSMKFGKQI